MPAAKEAGGGEKRCGRRTQRKPGLSSQRNALLRSRAMSRSPATMEVMAAFAYHGSRSLCKNLGGR